MSHITRTRRIRKARLKQGLPVFTEIERVFNIDAGESASNFLELVEQDALPRTGQTCAVRRWQCGTFRVQIQLHVMSNTRRQEWQSNKISDTPYINVFLR